MIAADLFVQDTFIFSVHYQQLPRIGEKLKFQDRLFKIEDITWITPTFVQMDLIKC